MRNEVWVLCVLERDEHTDDSLLIHCEDCQRKVWITLKNMDKKALCIDCLKIRIEESKKRGEDVQAFVTVLDVYEAIAHFRKKGKRA